MIFKLETSKKADKFLEKLDPNERDKIIIKLESILDNPYYHLKKLHNTKLWRLRIENYRAIIDIIIKGRTIFVVRIGHRKNIYKK